MAILGIADFAAFDRLAAEAGAGAAGVTSLPALSGAMATQGIASARGCFYGLTPAQSAGQLARAALEGCAVAGGRHADIPSRAARVGGEIETVEPDPAARAAYDDVYGGDRRLFDSLRPMFERAAPGAAP